MRIPYLLMAVLLGFLTSAAAPSAVPTPQTSIADRVSAFSADTASGSSEEAQLSWQQQVRREGDQRVIEMTIVNHSDERRCIAIEHRFRFEGMDHRAFIPSVESHPDSPEGGQITCAYLREDREWMHMGLPFASLLSTEDGSGTSFSANLGNMPILPFEVRMWRHENENITSVSIRRPQVRLEPNATNVISLYVASHGGNWREGLAWIRDRWPSLFIVPDGMRKYQWSQWGGTGFYEGAYDHTVAQNPLKRGIAGTRPRPWFGLNIADFDPWMIGVDQKYYLLRKMANIPGKPNAKLVARLRKQKEAIHAWMWLSLTDEKVRNHTQRLIDDGFTWHYYWNASETWRYWSQENHAASLYEPLSNDFWTDSTVLDPFPGSTRAAQLVDDARRIFDNYPNCSGLFLDQVYFDLTNHKADDGVSVSAEGKPFSRHQWNVWRVLRDIRRMADQRDKTIHANFIYNSLEIASLTDFGITEGMAALEKISAFYDIGNRLHICQSTSEQICQQAALLGWQTNLFSVPGLDPHDRRLRPWLNRLWFPIQMMFQERMLVLEPNCLTLREGITGNVFRRPDGNSVVPIVTPGVSHLSPYEWAEMPVVIRLSDAARVKRVYQLASDRLGPVALDFKRRDRELHITLPRHRSTSMLVLAAAGKFVALAESTIRPGGVSTRIHYDDLDGDQRETRTLPVPASSATAKFVLIQPDPVMRAVLPNPQWEIDRRPDFELHVTKVVEVTLGPDPSLVYKPHETYGSLVLPASLSLSLDQETTVQAAVHNYGDAPVTLPLNVKAEGLDVESRSAQAAVAARSCETIELCIRGQGVGPATLTVTAGVADCQLKIDVVGNHLTVEDLARIQKARLCVDTISNGPINTQMTLNGVPAGVLTQRVGHPVWDRRVAHDLTEEATAAFKTAGNLLEIRTENRLFTVARPVLEIELSDGRRMQLTSDDPPQSTPPDWLQSQGRRIPSGKNMQWTFK